jgi:hypothetical protein
MVSGRLGLESGPLRGLCSYALSALMLWHAEGRFWSPSWSAPSLPRRRRLREGVGDPLVRLGGGAVCREVVIWIWVAALLVIDFDDLVGRGNCHARRRDKREV